MNQWQAGLYGSQGISGCTLETETCIEAKGNQLRYGGDKGAQDTPWVSVLKLKDIDYFRAGM